MLEEIAAMNPEQIVRKIGTGVEALLLAAIVLNLQPVQAASPALGGFDATVLLNLEGQIRAGELSNVHSVLVIKDEQTEVEWYFEGPDERRGKTLGVVEFAPETLHDVRSVTKSVVSLLFGIALAEGAIESLDEPVLNFFPEYADLYTPERLQIRLSDLLSQTSGIRWDERTLPYTNPRNSETAMDMAEDRYRYILSQPIESVPGEQFNYSGGNVALLAAIIARATNTPIETYASTKLFLPLGITQFDWVKDQKGIPYAASGLRLRPRDMAKMGQLMLQEGHWVDRQIVPATWIETSTSRHAQFLPDLQCGVQYGYLWFLGTICAGDFDTPFFFASGNGGQNIMVFPSLSIVIVTTAGMYNDIQGDRSTNNIIEKILGLPPRPVPSDP